MQAVGHLEETVKHMFLLIISLNLNNQQPFLDQMITVGKLLMGTILYQILLTQ